MRLIDYSHERFNELHQAVMEWRGDDRVGTFSLSHVGIVPHSINSVKGRWPLGEFVKLYLVEDVLEGFFIAQGVYNGFDIFMNPQLEKAIMKELIEGAYHLTRQQMDGLGRHEMAVNTDVFEPDTQRQDILLELGFEQREQWQNLMRRDLNEPIDAPQLPKGFLIRPSTMADYEQLAAVHSGAFGSNWNPEVYRDEIMSKPGYAPEREVVVIAPDGRFAAFCVYWLDTRNKVGLFEPVGTHQDFQRKGLGRALLNHTLALMKVAGMKEAEIGHETDNPASTNLYASVGFRFYQHVWRYSRI